jgi:hypothetical protein
MSHAVSRFGSPLVVDGSGRKPSPAVVDGSCRNPDSSLDRIESNRSNPPWPPATYTLTDTTSATDLANRYSPAQTNQVPSYATNYSHQIGPYEFGPPGQWDQGDHGTVAMPKAQRSFDAKWLVNADAPAAGMLDRQFTEEDRRSFHETLEKSDCSQADKVTALRNLGIAFKQSGNAFLSSGEHDLAKKNYKSAVGYFTEALAHSDENDKKGLRSHLHSINKQRRKLGRPRTS